MSQYTLAEKISAQQKEVSYYETGEREPSSERVFLLSQALQVSIDWLYGLSDSMISSGDDSLTEVEHEALEIIRSKSLDEQIKLINVLKALA